MTENSSKAFGLRLREMRKAMKLSQKAFGKAYGGISQDGITRAERGVSGSIPLRLLCNIATLAVVNGISVTWLFTGLGEMQAGIELGQAAKEDLATLLHAAGGLATAYMNLTSRMMAKEFQEIAS